MTKQSCYQAFTALLLLLPLSALGFAPQVDEVGGNYDSNNAGNNAYKLNLFDVSAQAQLDTIEIYLDPQVNNAEVVYTVYGPSALFAWELIWDSGRQTLSGGAGFKASPNVGLLLQPGTTYAIGVYLTDDEVEYWYEDTGPENLGWATVNGAYFAVNGSEWFGPPDPIFGGNEGDSHYYQRITVVLPEDVDGDGVDELSDCDDNEPLAFPGNPEVQCDGVDNDCDPGTVDDTDNDGDGVSVCSGDCDDTNTQINPAMVEVLCDGLDNDCDAATSNNPDDDLDGQGVCGDCDDTDPYTYTGAPELCDGIDNDCDDAIDENVVYLDHFDDADGDGYGDPTEVQTACDGPPAGFVADNGDCDDGDASIHPAAEEICDGLDQDCDGEIDEGLATTDWFADTDGDGYGDGEDILNSCDTSPPAGYSDVDGDCDPTDNTVFPDADEFCDGVDNDCDTEVDEEVVYRDVFADLDGDGFGDDNDTQSVCEPETPAGWSEDGGDCDDGDELVYPGAEEICDGLDNDCDGALGPDEIDGDGDGFLACDDCNDVNPNTNPDREETCNGIDNDCDGIAPTQEDCDPYVGEDLKIQDCGCNSGAPVNGSWLVLALVVGLRRAKRPTVKPGAA